MKFNRLFLNLFLIALTLKISGCKTDVDLIGPYKETAVIYGLLNQRDTVQYIKINRTFLGQGSALDMAKVPDSLNYNPDDIKAWLDEFNVNGSKLRTINLKDTVIDGGKPGTFSKDNNIIYMTREALVTANTYVLSVENMKTGYKATSTTALINDITLNVAFGSEIRFKSDPTTFIDLRPKWNTARNGRTYELIVRFNYKEYVSGNDTVYKFIDWRQNILKAGNLNGGTELAVQIKGEDFYRFLQAQKSAAFSTQGVNRRAGKIQFFVVSGGEELTIYSEVNSPSSSVIYQERPYYTNIKNGLGIFSCRYSSPVLSYDLSSLSLLELLNGEFTKDLEFRP
jgi:hypothetical protein